MNRRVTGTAAGVVAAGVATGVGIAIARRGSGRKRAIVVGSGAAGSTVARVLARSGQYDVLVLEKGRQFHTGLGGDVTQVQAYYPDDELAYEVRTPPIAQDPILEPRSFRESPSAGVRTVVGDVDNLPIVVGGATAHYDAKARRFREVDFIANTLMGGTRDKPAIAGTTYTDWPIEYRHLEPFYAVMEEVIGIQGPAYRDSSGRIVNPNPAESPRSTPFPMPPGVAMYTNLVLSDAANRLGYHAVPVPTSVNSRPYRGRNPCNDCSFCLDFGCPVNAKGGGIWVLHDALTTGKVELRSQCNVVHIETDSNGSNGRHRATGVTYIDADGNRHTEAADVVVLANTPFEAVRLSLRSGIGSAPDEKDLSKVHTSSADPSGLLGRNLMLHLQTTVYAVFNQELHPWRGRTSTHTMDDFAGAGPGRQRFDATVPRGGVVEIGGNQNPISEATSMTAIAQREKLKQLLRLSPYRKHLAAFTMQGEDMPQLANYVDLDPEIVDVYGEPVPRITYKSHKYELDASDHYTAKLMDVMHAVGGSGTAYPGVKALLVAKADRGQVPQDKHIMGTHRMALDSDHGPCNPFGRYWAFDNLYHAGGGLFVTAPGYNVTHTIWALGYWVAAAILTGADQKQSYTAGDIDANWDGLLGAIRSLDGDTMAARALHRSTSA